MEQSLKQTVDGNRMMTNNDDEMIMVIQKTHSPDGKYFDLGLLLQLVKKMLTPTANPENESMDEKALQEALGGPEALATTIHKISCELCCNCSGRDELSTTSELFKKMSRYSWDTKVVLALAAFALFYGELNLMTVTFSDHPMAKAIKLLKQFPQESRLFLSSPNTLTSLIEAIVIATIRVVNFNRQLPHYFSTQSHTAVYWIVRSVVACAFHIMGFVGLGYKSIPQITDTAATEFSRLKDKVSESQNLLERWYWQRIGAREPEEIFSTLDHLFQFETTVIDNTEIFKILFNAKDEQQPLLKCFPGKQERCGVDVLRGKKVILAVSESVELDEELNHLYKMYQKSLQQKQAILYEVVWLRLLDKTKVKEGDIQHTQITLPWYIVHYDHIPSINEGVTMHIKKKWLFNKKSILVMLDEQGKIVSPNAIHRFQIFERVDFNTREEYIWKKVKWGLEFWFDGIDKGILNWIKDGRYLCLYGGKDLDWIKTLKTEVQKVENETIKFEMMYVGSKNLKENEKKIFDETKKVGSFLETYSSFWFRLESMFYSMMQNKNSFEEDNQQMVDIKTMLSFNESEKGWALISKGSTTMAKARGDKIIKCFQEYNSWKKFADQKGFVEALNDQLEELKKKSPSHCNHLAISEAAGWIPESLKCTDCGRCMEKLVTFRCCID